jgi:metal-sulfur cluster biosynthetic enzyme
MEELKEKILNALNEVLDPEIGYGLVDLGMVEEVEMEGNKIKVKILPTTPFCPLIYDIIFRVEEKLKKKFKGYEIEVSIDTENQWTPERIKKEIREKLGI